MKGTRYCGKIHGNSIAKRLGSHLDCLFSRRDEFMSCSLMDGFQQRPRCMDIYRPHSACKAMAQLRVSTQQIKIKTGQALCIPRDTRPLGHTSTRLWRSFLDMSKKLRTSNCNQCTSSLRQSTTPTNIKNHAPATLVLYMVFMHFMLVKLSQERSTIVKPSIKNIIMDL